MIVSHSNHYFFIKTAKTAGTSIEISLTHHVGPADIVTEQDPNYPDLLSSIVPLSGLNNEKPFSCFNVLDWKTFLKNRVRPKFWTHCPASEVRRLIGQDSFENYFSFAVVRNPFDRAISLYWYKFKKTAETMRPTISEFIAEGPPERFSDWSRISINNRIAVKKILKYESLQLDLDAISKDIGFNISIKDINAKSGIREGNAHYSELLNRRDVDRLELYCRREIDEFNYSF